MASSVERLDPICKLEGGGGGEDRLDVLHD